SNGAGSSWPSSDPVWWLTRILLKLGQLEIFGSGTGTDRQSDPVELSIYCRTDKRARTPTLQQFNGHFAATPNIP
ncbi:hypothetical protein, partial [Thalassospira sp.]|uniref:hypothetical protein n=1 Tax=Thalassospira sp. TaxID=1912094 RepID=UPI00257C68FA